LTLSYYAYLFLWKMCNSYRFTLTYGYKLLGIIEYREPTIFNFL